VSITQDSGFRYSAVADSGWFTASYAAGITPELGEGWQGLAIKLNPRNGFPGTPGTYDLSEQGENPGECGVCVFVTYAGSGDHFQLDFATSGTFEIEEVDTETGELQGRLSDVTFRHLKEVALHAFEGVHPDGHCTTLAKAEVDTRAIPGAPCLEASECPNAKLQVCDPSTGTCADAACSSENPECSGDSVCQIQDTFFEVGACYDRCTPFTSGACGEGLDCVPVDYVGKVGVCKQQGPESPEPATQFSPDRSCTPYATATGCGPNHVCTTHAPYWHYDHCFRQCDYFGEQTGCDVGQCWMMPHRTGDLEKTYVCGRGDCHKGGICVETDGGEEFGSPCEGDRYIGAPCFGSSQLSGVCVGDSADELVCRRLCLLGESDCGSETCRQLVVEADTNSARSVAGLGYCAP
jgi:hypothetical protein